MAEKLKICSGCGKRIPFNSDCECLIKKRRQYDRTRRKKRNDKELKTYRWQKLRMKIIKRDGGYCKRCLEKYGIINTERLTVHHIKSRENYPELMWEETNLVTVCMSCNNILDTHDKLDFEFKIKETNWEVY